MTLPGTMNHCFACIAVVAAHALGVSFLGGCGSDGGDDVDAGGFVDDRPIELRGACPADERAGRFRLEVILEGGGAGSFLSGEILDRVDPLLARELVNETGDCQLLRRTNPLCDPGCAGDEVCNIMNQCVPQARGIDAGPIRLGGLVANVEMEPRPPGNNYFDTQLSHPAISGGEELRLRTTSGDLAIDGLGTEPLVVTGDDWVISEGQPLAVTWEPPTQSNPDVAVQLTLTIDQHGTTPVTLVCLFEDDGTGDVPAAVVDALFTAGVSGFPNGILERQTNDSQDRDGTCVDFQVAHPRRHPSSVSGHTPCNGPNQCPQGQTCDLGTNTCVDE